MSFARVRAFAIVGALVTCAAILVAVTLFKDKQRGPIDVESCPKDAVIANIKLPVPQDVKITMIDATGSPSTTYNVSEQLKHRQFQVTRSQQSEKTTNKVAILRFGPKAVGASWLIKAYFLNTADAEFDIKRTDDTVDVVLGSGFRKLATATEVGQALAQLGRPTQPPGTCAIDQA